MPTTVNLTGNIADLIGADFDPRRTKVWVTTNLPGDVLIDATGNEVRLGDAYATVSALGVFTFTGLWATDSATTPTAFQYQLHIDYPKRSASKGRETWSSGWFDLTATADIADVAQGQYVPPTWMTTATETLREYVDDAEAARDAAVDISNIDTSDAVVEALVKNTGGAGPLTRAALATEFASLDESGEVPDEQIPATIARTLDIRTKTVAAIHASGDLVPELSQTIEVSSPHLNSIAFDGFTLVTGTYPGGAVWVSYDKGLSWQSMGKPAGDAAIDDIAFVKAARPGVFYAGCSNSGGPSKLFKSTDSGATWTLVFTAPSAAEATEGLSIECIGRTVLIGGFNRVAGTSAGIWRSTNDGATFTKVSTTDADTAMIRQIRHVYNNVHIAGVRSASPNELNIYRSADGGATWTSQQIIPSSDCYSAAALPNGGVLLGMHPDGKIYRSTNFGQAPYTEVANLGLGPGQSQVFGLTRIGKTVLAFVNRNDNAESKVYASDDNGITWTEVASLDATYHYHEPVMVDWRTVVAPAAHNLGGTNRGVIYRMSWYG